MPRYSELPTLEHLYLEDSWVLGIALSADTLTFTMQFVLTVEHPSYRGPKPGEQYHYASGVLEFSGVKRILWPEAGQINVVRDLDGTFDVGNIDSLTVTHDGYVIGGDWGLLTVTASAVSARLVD